MTRRGSSQDAVLHRLIDVSHTLAPEALPELVQSFAATYGVDTIGMYLIGYAQRRLFPMDGLLDSLVVEDTTAGTAYMTIEPQIEHDRDRFAVWVPIIDGAERVGVLHVESSTQPDVDALTGLAGMVAFLLHSKRDLTLLYDQSRRDEPMPLAAEMQWSLLPPLNYQTDSFEVAAALEPAYDIGGDAFDYSHDGDVLHFVLADAMGQGRNAVLLATLALASIRHSWVDNVDLAASYERASEQIRDQFGDGQFVTAVLGTLDRSGTLQLVSAGHP